MIVPGLTWVPLGRLLTDGRVLTQEQLDFALAEKAESGKRLGEIIVELGFTTERAIAGALAEQYGLEYVDLEGLKLDRDAVALLTETLARRYEALPIRILDDGVLLLAVTDPTNLANADDLRFALGANFRLAVAERKQIDLAISRAYRQSLELIAEDTEQTANEEQVVHDLRDMASSAPTITLVNSLLRTAVEEGASDIHFEPQRNEMIVRIRVDGVMRELATIPKHMQPAVASRLKIMGKLNIADRRSPQDGRVSAFFGSGPIDLRIAVLTTTHGEQIVLRILGRGDRTPTLAELEMEPKAEEAFKTSIEQPYGAVIVCGPTGSGKTTTLYGSDRSSEHTGTRRDDNRGPGRVPAGRDQPDRGRRQGWTELCARPPHDPAQRSRRAARRRDPRCRDGVDRHPGRDDRTPRARRRCTPTTPRARSRASATWESTRP